MRKKRQKAISAIREGNWPSLAAAGALLSSFYRLVHEFFPRAVWEAEDQLFLKERSAGTLIGDLRTESISGSGVGTLCFGLASGGGWIGEGWGGHADRQRIGGGSDESVGLARISTIGKIGSPIGSMNQKSIDLPPLHPPRDGEKGGALRISTIGKIGSPIGSTDRGSIDLPPLHPPRDGGQQHSSICGSEVKSADREMSIPPAVLHKKSPVSTGLLCFDECLRLLFDQADDRALVGGGEGHKVDACGLKHRISDFLGIGVSRTADLPASGVGEGELHRSLARS